MKLRVTIFTNEKGTFTAICPSLPGCVCEGDTHDHAREKLDEAIKGYIAAVNNFVPDFDLQEVAEV
ncbi:MAG TPA: HicB family protein [Phycisphaerales bacterium]|nr:HicB family protein [Phycisphaerales bacterium]